MHYQRERLGSHWVANFCHTRRRGAYVKKNGPTTGAFLQPGADFALWRASRSWHDAVQGLAAGLNKWSFEKIPDLCVGSASHRVPRQYAKHEMTIAKALGHRSHGRDERDSLYAGFDFD